MASHFECPPLSCSTSPHRSAPIGNIWDLVGLIQTLPYWGWCPQPIRGGPSTFSPSLGKLVGELGSSSQQCSHRAQHWPVWLPERSLLGRQFLGTPMLPNQQEWVVVAFCGTLISPLSWSQQGRAEIPSFTQASNSAGWAEVSAPLPSHPVAQAEKSHPAFPCAAQPSKTGQAKLFKSWRKGA